MCRHRRLSIQCGLGDREDSALEHDLWGQILGEEDDDVFFLSVRSPQASPRGLRYIRGSGSGNLRANAGVCMGAS